MRGIKKPKGHETEGLLGSWVEGLFLEFLEVDVAPADVAFFTAVDLETEEAFWGGMLWVGVLEVDTLLAVEPGLEVVADALDGDLVPAFHFGDLEALLGEVGHVLFVAFAWEEPSAAGFIVESCGP